MAYTTHGHHIPGTILEGPEPSLRARCGGPGLCKVCSEQAASYSKLNTVDETYHDENTLDKVWAGLSDAGIPPQQRLDAISAMQNNGILFRERKPD